MRKSDSQLQNDVMEELVWDPSVGRSEVAVAAKDGVITLAGQVDSYAKRDAAMKAAERVSGVRAIADELTVKIPASFRRTDIDIAHSVAESLKWDIQVPDEKVKARIDGGWVWLDGEVDWEYQRAAAERCVRYLAGVAGVSNNIRIKKVVFAPEVKSRIESALKRNAAVDAAHISVETLDGKVTLRGHVHSWSARSDAERAAWSAPGVVVVQDELTVQV